MPTHTASTPSEASPSAGRIRKPRKRSGKVTNSWLTEYGLNVSARDVDDGNILSVSCRFCFAFGREKVDVRTRRKVPIKVVKHWRRGRGGFRTDNFVSHFRNQHEQKWEEFSALPLQKKKSFFDTQQPFAESICAHFGLTANGMARTIRRAIVDDILKALLLEDDSTVSTISSSLSYCISENVYQLKILNKGNFEIVVGQVALGGTFRLTCNSIAKHRSSGVLAYVGHISEQDVSNSVQSLSMLCLQTISEFICDPRCWAFSIALDAGTNHGESYVDVRARFCAGSKLHNFHLLAIPLRTRHTGENMCDIVSRLLNALGGSESMRKVVGISSDGAASMVGRINGAVTRLERLMPSGVYRVWCGAHQLDLAVQDAFESTLKAQFQDPLHSLISYLRRQVNLKAEMGTVCPTVSTTRWLSLGEVCKWLTKHRIRIQEYLVEKEPAQAPDKSWWLLLLMVCALMEPVNICFKSIQGQDTLLSHQNHRINVLCENIQQLTGIKKVNSGVDVLAIAAHADMIDQSHGLIATVSGLNSFVDELGSYAVSVGDSLGVEEREDVYHDFAGVVLRLCHKIDELVVLRDSRNAPNTNRVPPVLPHMLRELSARDFYALVNDQKDRLSITHSPEQIEEIEVEFLRFRKDPMVSQAPVENRFVKFEAAWKELGVRYGKLLSFCGGLATVFSGTATVESDFSIINFEASAQRRMLSNLSLAGILHAKQWDDVKRLSFN